MEYSFTDGTNADFILLCHALDDYLDELAGSKGNRSQYVPLNQLDDIHDVIIAYDKGTPVGCASYKKYASNIAEMKRVFVRLSHRGQGISKVMLRALEKRAAAQGCTEMLLESGEPLKAAMILYKSTGYEIIPNYGPYADMPDAICMRKYLQG